MFRRLNVSAQAYFFSSKSLDLTRKLDCKTSKSPASTASSACSLIIPLIALDLAKCLKVSFTYSASTTPAVNKARNSVTKCSSSASNSRLVSLINSSSTTVRVGSDRY